VSILIKAPNSIVIDLCKKADCQIVENKEVGMTNSVIGGLTKEGVG